MLKYLSKLLIIGYRLAAPLAIFRIACSFVRSEHFLGILGAPFPRSWRICIFTLRIEIRNSGCRANTRCSDTAESVGRQSSKWNRWIAGSPGFPHSAEFSNRWGENAKCACWADGRSQKPKNQRTRTRPKCSQANKFKMFGEFQLLTNLPPWRRIYGRGWIKWMADNERRCCW